MVAIPMLLEVHATWLVRFTVAPDDVVPMARNCAVCPGAVTVCEPGITASDTTEPPAVTPPDEVTVITALELAGPLNATALAVIVAEPAPTAVTKPEEFTAATEAALELQVTEPLMFCVDG
jgi:hypothetical protein